MSVLKIPLQNVTPVCSSHLGTETEVVPQNPCVVWPHGNSSSFISSNFPLLSLVSPFCSPGGGFVLFLCSINFLITTIYYIHITTTIKLLKQVFKYIKSPILEQEGKGFTKQIHKASLRSCNKETEYRAKVPRTWEDKGAVYYRAFSQHSEL